ncbi:hypothetical protein BSY19_4863 (plasmid) [Bosea sp. RAC05]|nr:hypothetical protein BSY19_4863 [Bosea sp. RAC05]
MVNAETTIRRGRPSGGDEVKALSVRIGGVPIARLSHHRNGRLSLRYLDSWIDKAGSGAYPLSLSLPVREGVHGHTVVEPFLAGLLPDNPNHRKILGSIFGVTGENDFSLLGEIGRDCAGAVSIVAEDEPIVLEDDVPEDYQELSEADLAKLIRELPQRPLFAAEESFRLSLAGVNDKAAVLVKNGKVCLPRNGYPSAQILKADIQRLPDSIRLENYCLRVASAMGLKVPKSRVLMAEDVHYMLIARYDRVISQVNGKPRLRRIHQIDFCQAMNVKPTQKYEDEGGPSWRSAFKLMESTVNPSESKIELLRRALGQVLWNNPDAHGKNYSLICRADGYRLAPLYDINSAAAFRDCFKTVKPRLAMSVGGEFDPTRLTGQHWARFASDARVQPGLVRSELLAMAKRLPDIAVDVEASMKGTPEWSPRIGIAIDDIAARCADIPAMLAREPDQVPAPDQTRDRDEGADGSSHIFSM